MTIDHAILSSGDAMSDGTDFAELFDIKMDEFARHLAFIAANRFRLQGAEFVQASAGEEPRTGAMSALVISEKVEDVVRSALMHAVAAAL